MLPSEWSAAFRCWGRRVDIYKLELQTKDPEYLQSRRRSLLGPSPWLWNIHEPSNNLRLKLYTNCHLHSCLRLWCGREERIWWSHEYEYEESRFRQTSLTGLDQDRQLAHSHLRYNTDFFLRCLSATAATCSPAPARPLLPCHETQCSISPAGGLRSGAGDRVTVDICSKSALRPQRGRLDGQPRAENNNRCPIFWNFYQLSQTDWLFLILFTCQIDNQRGTVFFRTP